MTDSKFRAWRLSQGLTLEAAAERLGLAVSTIHKLDTGKSVDIKTAVAVEHLTGVHYSSMIPVLRDRPDKKPKKWRKGNG